MIRLLNVYYPTRTVFLLMSEALIICSCLYAAVWLVLGRNAYVTLNYEYGGAKIIALTVTTMTVAYYFDLYEPDLLFDRREIYFRIVLALGCVCLLVAGVVYFYPEFSISREVFPLALLLLGCGALPLAQVLRLGGCAQCFSRARLRAGQRTARAPDRRNAGASQRSGHGCDQL